MYASMDINGDGITDDNLDRNVNIKKDKIVPGNLGLYSGCCPLPNLNGHEYKINTYYETMELYPQKIRFENNLGLTQMPDYKIVENGIGGKGVFYPSDGRIIDSVRNMRTILDKPAETGFVDMNKVSTFDNRNYGGPYKTYSDIKNGQISYYTDPGTSQPFFSPVYTLTSTVDKTIFKDPMDSVKPQYYKKPITSTLHNVSNDQFTRDQLFFREDLMSRQQNLYNRTSWVNRWVKND